MEKNILIEIVSNVSDNAVSLWYKGNYYKEFVLQKIPLGRKTAYFSLQNKSTCKMCQSYWIYPFSLQRLFSSAEWDLLVHKLNTHLLS